MRARQAMRRRDRGRPTMWAVGDRGSGTVLGLAAIGVLFALLLAGLALSSAILASGKARTAADLAAVGGAQHLLLSQSQALVCERVADIAQQNSAQMESCAVAETAKSGPTVTVVVMVEAGALGTARGTAKAGLFIEDQP